MGFWGDSRRVGEPEHFSQPNVLIPLVTPSLSPVSGRGLELTVFLSSAEDGEDEPHGV